MFISSVGIYHKWGLECQIHHSSLHQAYRGHYGSRLSSINKLCFKHFETVFVFHTPSLRKPIWNSSPGSLSNNLERQLGC